jgi:putative ABC transport system permease protein
MAIFRGEPAIVVGPSGTERVLSQAVSANLFALLGVKPLVGRTFTPDEDERGDLVVVLSHGLWLRQFGGSPGVIDTMITLSGGSTHTRYRIVGVMPREFCFPSPDVQFWRPAFDGSRSAPPRWKKEDRYRFISNNLGVIGRLRAGTTIEQARADMNAIGQRLAATHVSPTPDFPGFAVSVVPLIDQVTGRTLSQTLWMLFGAVSVVLLIACVNVANLVLVRSAARSREFAVRVALGATRARLVRQSLTESAALTVAAAVVGLLLASGGLRALASVAPAGVYPERSTSYALTDSVPVPVGSAQPGVPRLDEVSLDARILFFTIAICGLTSIVLGLVPARRLTSAQPQTVLGRGGRTTTGHRALSRTHQGLAALECGLAVVLLVGAVLLMASLSRLHRIDPGFSSDGVLLVRVSVAPQSREATDSPVARDPMTERRVFYQEMKSRLQRLPGIERVGQITDFFANVQPAAIGFPDRPPETLGQLGHAAIDSGFFQGLGVPLVRGRFFSDADIDLSLRLHDMSVEEHRKAQATEAVIVNELFARRVFGSLDVVGRRFGDGDQPRWWSEIVGVVGNMRRDRLDRAPVAEYFTPYIGQTSELAIRTSGEPLAIAGPVRDAIRSTGARAIVMTAVPLERKLAEADAGRRLQTWLLTLFAALALLLAAIGVYSVVRYAVAQRTHELGVRIALGARPLDILLLVIRQGLVAPLAGLAGGLMAALALTRLIAHVLFETSTTDSLTLGVVAVVLLVASLVACYFPARRAAKVDPITALRTD